MRLADATQGWLGEGVIQGSSTIYVCCDYTYSTKEMPLRVRVHTFLLLLYLTSNFKLGGLEIYGIRSHRTKASTCITPSL